MPDDLKTDLDPSDSDASFFYTIWIIIFGVILGIGGSVLENVQVNPMAKLFFSGPFVIAMLTINKIVLLRRFSVMHMYVVASMIAIVTNYLGPPSPLKPLFILAGLSFDLGTGLKTNNIRFVNILVGQYCATISGFSLAFLITYIVSPDLAVGLVNAFIFATLIYAGMIPPIAWIVWKAIPINAPPEVIRQIRSTMERCP